MILPMVCATGFHIPHTLSLKEKKMSAQPRLFTAKRKTNATVNVRHQPHHHERHHAQAQKAPRTKKETVEDTYGDLS
jgi:hypothetical protein